jgi:amino acid permease
MVGIALSLSYLHFYGDVFSEVLLFNWDWAWANWGWVLFAILSTFVAVAFGIWDGRNEILTWSAQDVDWYFVGFKVTILLVLGGSWFMTDSFEVGEEFARGLSIAVWLMSVMFLSFVGVQASARLSQGQKFHTSRDEHESSRELVGQRFGSMSVADLLKDNSSRRGCEA